MNPAILPPAPSVDDLMRMIAETHRSIVEQREQAREEARLQREQAREEARLQREQREQEREQREQEREQERKQREQEREQAHKEAHEQREQLKETERILNEAIRKSSERFDREMSERRKQAAETDRQLGRLGNRLGEFVEYMVRPAAVRLFQDRNLDVHQVIPNLCAYDDNRQLRSQVDLLVINNETAIVVECKSACSIDDVKEHLERLAEFKDCFPQYRPFKLLGAVAAVVMPDEVGHFAYRRGLFVMAQNGEIVEIRNDEKFEPATW